ncbi:unnamed protein product [Tilletia controversa]|nr:unnamed protein product [Tilletia controversa]
MGPPTSSRGSALDLLPMELWMQIAQEVAWARPDTIRKEDGASMAWQYGPKDHPLIALSQTCKTFQAIAAPLIWSNITFGQNWDDGGLDLIPKLIVCLKNPIVRETIESLDIDMDLNIDCLAPWEYGSWEGPDSVPTYLDLLALTTQLGDALRGTGLRDLRFCANWNNPSDAFLEAVGQGCPQLEHIELAYGSDNEPNVQEIDDVAVNGPDKLDELSQVRSACIGMGSIHDNDVLRLANGSYPYALEKHTPFLVKWLRGEVPSDASKEFNEVDNKLVHIKTSAPFLYRHQCLAPAWARFNHILEKIDGDNAEIEMSFTSGEMFDEDRCPGGDNYEEEMSWTCSKAKAQAQAHVSFLFRPACAQQQDHKLKFEAKNRAEAQRKALLAETAAAAKLELERRRAADARTKQEAELKRVAMVAQQKRIAEEARLRKENEERKKREADLDESQLPDLAQSKSAAKVLLNGARRNKGASATPSRPGAAKGSSRTNVASTSAGGDNSNMMATFNSVVRKTAKKKSASDLSLLTREEKRNRKLKAALGADKRAVPRSASMGSLRGAATSHSLARGMGSSSSGGAGSSAHGSASGSLSIAAAAQRAIASAKGPALPSFTRKAAVIGPDKTLNESITLGQNKRDKRTIEEIERDLRAAKEAKLLKEGGSNNATLEERKRREEEQKKLEEKRKLAMAQKRRLDLEAQGIVLPPPKIVSEPPSKENDATERARARTSSPVVLPNPKLLAAAQFYHRKASPTPPPSKIRNSIGGTNETAAGGAKGKRGRTGQRKSTGDSRDASPAVNRLSPGGGGAGAAQQPSRPETERERFIRLEAEKKRAAAANPSEPGPSSQKGKAVRRAQSDAEDDDEGGEEEGYDDDESDVDSFIVDDEDEMSGMEEDDDGDDDDDPRYRKKHKTSHAAVPSRSVSGGKSNGKSSNGRRSGGGGSGGGHSTNVREEIWQIFGRKRPNYSDMEDSDDDMEATAADIAREEVRSARIAKKEDEVAQAAEDARAREKAARLRQLAKKRAGGR